MHILCRSCYIFLAVYWSCFNAMRLIAVIMHARHSGGTVLIDGEFFNGCY
jgi:hypothetical protein